MSMAEVITAAQHWGCKLEMTVLGPAYRAELRSTPWRRSNDGSFVNLETGEKSHDIPPALEFKSSIGNPLGETDDVIMMEQRDLIGYTVGFVQPGGLLHLDTMQIRRFSGYWDRRKGVNAKEVPNPGFFGLGLILGGAAACFGRERGAERAELLAILDDEKQHRVLVRYYQNLGFKRVREVGEELSSFADRLVIGSII